MRINNDPMTIRRWSSLILASLLILPGLFEFAAADSVSPNVITYQGRLLENGSPATGTYNFDFNLFTAPSGGALLGADDQPGIAVTDGFFTVQLDFGSGTSVFDGNKRWLEILVGPSGEGQVTLPRQPITAAPYSSYALKAASAANAQSALNADYAGIAGWSDTADIAGYATTAGTAGSATTATTATTAGTANNANQLGGLEPSSYLKKNDSITIANPTSTASQLEIRDPNNANSGGSIWARAYPSIGPATTIYHNARVSGDNASRMNGNYPAWAATMATLTNDDNLTIYHSGTGTGAISWDPLFQITGIGELNIYEINDSPGSGNQFYTKLYSQDEGNYLRLFVADQQGNHSIISPHVSPSSVDSQAESSFTDTTIAYPWSFEHRNPLLGKGAIVDVAKVMAWAEAKMQAEKGGKAGRVFYYFDLPDDEKTSLDDYINSTIETTVKERLKKNPLIEVPLTSGRLPAEAWEQAEIMEDREVDETVSETTVDWDTLAVSKKDVTRKVRRKIGTGRYERHLKKGYTLGNGKLFREATEDDIKIGVDDIPMPPDWILDRLPEGRVSQADVRQRIETQLASRTEEIRDRAVASGSPAFAIENPTVELANAAH